jgi:sugar/nucleoside kinase (ribokinase family)
MEDVIVDPSRSTGIHVNRRGADGVHRFDHHCAGSAGCSIESADVARVCTDHVVFTHFTGVGLDVSATSAQACAALVRRTRATGGRISFSANVRPRLGPDFAVLRQGAAGADVVFVSAEDAALLYGHVEAAVAELALTAEEVVVTDGEHGATLFASPAPTSPLVRGSRRRGRALAQGVVAGASPAERSVARQPIPRADVLVGSPTPGGVSR